MCTEKSLQKLSQPKTEICHCTWFDINILFANWKRIDRLSDRSHDAVINWCATCQHTHTRDLLDYIMTINQVRNTICNDILNMIFFSLSSFYHSMQFRVICDMNCKNKIPNISIDELRYVWRSKWSNCLPFSLYLHWLKIKLFSSAIQLNLMFHYMTEWHLSNLLQLKLTMLFQANSYSSGLDT